MMKPTRIAVLSTAHIHAQAFLQRLQERADTHIHGIWDNNDERAQRYAERFSAPLVGNKADLLNDAACDGFLICAENTQHMQLLQAVLPIGKPVLCEKPLLTSAADLSAIQALQQQHATPLCSGWFQPFSAEMRGVIRCIESGACGTITRIRFRNAHHAAYGRWFDSPDLQWFTDPALSGGGAFMDMAAHAVHLLCYLFGAPQEVFAEIQNHSGEYPAVDDHGIALLRYANGIHGQVEAAWTQTGGAGGLEIVGSKGAIYQEQGVYLFALPGETPQPIAAAAAEPDRIDRLLALCHGTISQQELDRDLQATYA